MCDHLENKLLQDLSLSLSAIQINNPFKKNHLEFFLHPVKNAVITFVILKANLGCSIKKQMKEKRVKIRFRLL